MSLYDAWKLSSRSAPLVRSMGATARCTCCSESDSLSYRGGDDQDQAITSRRTAVANAPRVRRKLNLSSFFSYCHCNSLTTKRSARRCCSTRSLSSARHHVLHGSSTRCSSSSTAPLIRESPLPHNGPVGWTSICPHRSASAGSRASLTNTLPD